LSDSGARRVGSGEMKILYKPFAIVAGILGARIGRNVFKSLWAKIDDSEPPAPTAGNASTGKVVGAAALEAATLAAAGALAARASAKSFHHLFGVWPDKPKPSPEDDGAAPAAE
jgi:hypothetical protein